MKKIFVTLFVAINALSFAQSWQTKTIKRIENTDKSFYLTFFDSSSAYIQKQNVSYIVTLPNTNYLQIGYMYEGSTSRIITIQKNLLTQPISISASELADTLNYWLGFPSSGSGGSQTLSISNDTLTISGGNSVILPVYIQIDSSTINSYDVLNSQNTPPISPNTGDVYLVGNVPTGAWVGHAKDIAEWNGSEWVFTDGVQGDFLYNSTTALTYIFRSGNWVQTTGIPALNNGNTISSGLRIGTNNARSLTFETNNVNRGRFDSVGRFHVYNLPTATSADTFIWKANASGLATKVGQSTFLSGVNTALFPNGIEFVSASRDFQATDKGKLLILDGEVILTLPEIFPLEENDVIYIMLSGFGSKYQTQYAGNVIEGLSFGNGQPEVVKLGVASLSGNLGFIQLSESAFNNDKTALRYLYDQSQNAIPLSGTEVGNPVTGDIEVLGAGADLKIFSKGSDDIIVSSVNFGDGFLTLSAVNNNTGYSGNVSIFEENVAIASTSPISRGITAAQDFSSNITDLDYTQKIYVGFRGTATLSSGTVTVTTDKIKTGYKIYLSVNTPSGTQGFLSAPTGSIVDETEFVINSTSATDDSIVNWWIAP